LAARRLAIQIALHGGLELPPLDLAPHRGAVTAHAQGMGKFARISLLFSGK
jgi:hypothetical protein